jgi:hypothetical protein
VVEVSFEIFWSQRAKNDLYSLTPKLSDSERKVLMCGIEDILKLDPRPVAYRGTHENPNPYLSRYGFRFENWNVAFEIKTRSPLDLNDSGALQMAEITSIEKWSN